MNWLWLPVVAALCYAISAFIDNFAVDTYCRRKNAKCMAMVYVVVELVVCGVILGVTGGAVLTGVGLEMIGVFMLAGFINFLASIPYYRALKDDETTEVALLSQMSPVLALGLSFVLLKEVISMQQLVAFFMILAMALFIVVGSGKRRIRMKVTAGGYMLLACFLWVMSDIVFVTQARGVDFLTSFFWLVAGIALSNILAFAVMKSWREDFGRLLKRKRGRKLLVLGVNETVNLTAEILWRFGLMVMPVAIMSVTGNVAQLILTFVLGVILTLLVPKFGREKLNKKLVVNHALATGVIAIAVVLLG